jgi:rhodanese-related sulfurtransferase
MAYPSRKVEELSPYEISEILESEPESALIIDVREPWEFYGDMGHVKGSLLIPMSEIPDNLENLKSSGEKKIILMCNSGERSYYTARYLMDNSVKNVFNADGGIIKWHMAGLEVEFGE